MKRVTARDLGGAELADTFPSETPGDEVTVYVLTLELGAGGGDYGSWTSVHRTIDGARRRIDERVDEWGMADEYAVARAAEVESATSIASGEEGDPVIYGINLHAVEA